MKTNIGILLILLTGFCMNSCNDDIATTPVDNSPVNPEMDTEATPDVLNETFQGSIDLNNLHNYSDQFIPDYIDEDNTRNNEINDMTATLGRVLFYDNNLSSNNTTSCASCHKQEFAFGDDNRLSLGANGTTGRQSMRLVNARFGEERRFFWDERADNLEEQTTMPIQDHGEMGFSGQNGDPDLNDLFAKLEGIEYYNELFTEAFGDITVNEDRLQTALAQFIRSIQSFDSKYDIGREMVNNPNQPFPNFTQEENMGKDLFRRDIQFQGNSGNRIGGGLDCSSCHQGDEFDINDNSRNNGVIAAATLGAPNELDITRSPSLRDLFGPSGNENTPMMHNGNFSTIEMVLAHYNDIDRAGNNNLDQRLGRGGGVNLNMTQAEITAVSAFLKTLTGSDMYTNTKWSNPFPPE